MGDFLKTISMYAFGYGYNAWNSVNPIMIWVNKLVPKLYGWSDLVIKRRQDKANYKYKMEKAEKKAYEIMKAQQEQRAKAKMNATVSDDGENSGSGRRRKRSVQKWGFV